MNRFYNYNHFGMVGGVLVLLASCLVLPPAHGQAVSNRVVAVNLSLNDYLNQVLQHNQSIQAAMLETEVNRHKQRAELGVFEPQLDSSVTREENKRLNNTEQQAAQGGDSLFREQNTLYNGAVETVIPTGGKIRLGATMSDLANNINPGGIFGGGSLTNLIEQYQTFVGATFTQPLLKDAWFGPTLANYRLAALDSDIAFQQYRRQLMLTLSQAEGAYWNLYFAQEQVQFFDDSVAVAQEVLDDTREKMKAGQSAELDVMEAQSALALRKTKRNDAIQNYYDALDRMRTLAGEMPNPELPPPGSQEFRAVDNPRTTNSPPTYESTYEQASLLNPDYLIQYEKMNEQRLRYGVAKSQLLPELDMNAAYGYNGLGNTPADAWDSADSRNYPSWSLGLELIVPLGGNIKGRNGYKAARMSLQEEYINLKNVETQMANSLSTAIQKARAWQQSIDSYQTVVDYNQELLQTELARLKAGTIEAQQVLDDEANLLDSRQDLAGALSQYRGALLQIELSDGALLKNRGLDVSRNELRQQTEAMLEHNQNYAVENIPSPPDKFFPPVPPEISTDN